MSWRPHHLGEVLADLEQRYMRGELDLPTWERERQLAIIDDRAEYAAEMGEGAE